MRDWAIMLRERPGRAADVAAVPYGFSWGALLFQALWALWYGAWLTALVLVTAGVLASLIAQAIVLDPAGVAIVEVATVVVLAFAAQDLRRFELERRRFRTVDVVAARTAAEAELRALAGLVDHPGDQRGEVTGISPARGLQAPADRSM